MSATDSSTLSRTIAIASGKGGVGKTFITANLAMALAQQLGTAGKVVAMDLDLGCSNLNTCLGVRSLNFKITDFLLQKTRTLDNTMTTTEVKNLMLIGGSNGSPLDLQKESGQWKDRLSKAIRDLNASFTLLDLAGGVTPEVTDFFLAARERVVVIVPESLSLHNGFVFIKSAILRLLELELGRFDYLRPVRDKVREIVASEDNIELKTLLERLRAWDVVATYVVRGIIDELRIKLVINMYRGGQEKTYLQRFHHLLLKHLYLRNFEYLGIVHFGKNVRQTVQGMKPFLLAHPQDGVSRDIGRIASKLITNQEDLEPRLEFPEGWFEMILKKK